MNTSKLKGISKLIIITFFIIVTLIGGVMASLSILKEEAVNANIRMVKLQADTFSENLSQTINTLDLLFNSLPSFFELTQESHLLDEQFMTILKNNPHIRSINLLENHKVIVSSNPNNLNTVMNLSDFYPKPFFNQAILQVGTVFMGRDLDEINPNDHSKKNTQNQPSFIPIVKKIHQTNKTYHVLVVLNPDYFINLYASKLEPYTYVDILRLDDTVLASSQAEVTLCDKCEANAILLNSKEQN
ncbi:MAG: hypothetical protein CVU67_02050, partial [Deltaproteobacteria bacterium HGW-Deltaproteobacteria-24]